jgi:hypothetical protein
MRGMHGLHVLGGLQKLWSLPIENMLSSSELDMVTDGGKEVNLLMVATKGTWLTKNKSPERVMCSLADKIWAGGVDTWSEKIESGF